MKIATWNVNSIRARLERLLAWLEAAAPDVVCLQELKVRDDDFPAAQLAEAGYKAAVFGQPTYNGVAILAHSEPQEVVTSLGDEVDDPQARLIAATVEGVRILSAYVPNGGEVGSEKYEYKLKWLTRLEEYLTSRIDLGRPVAVCGDFNMARDELDVDDPDKWMGSVLYNEEMMARLSGLLEMGLSDTVREHHPDGGVYSWWDYRRLGFPRNDGLRIDHIMASPSLAERCTNAYVDREERKGPKPSDHAPVVAEFSR